MFKKTLLTFLVCVGVTYSQAQTTVNFNDPQVKYMGRIGMKPDAAELTWTASSVIINFNGTGVKATLADDTGFDFVTVLIDGQVKDAIQLKNYKKEYTLAAGLPAGPHKVELFKRTEYDMGRMLFYKFTLDGDGKLLAPPSYKHRIEFYGNSITCGYAIEDLEGKDRGTYQYENGYKSYANLTARYFNADFNVIAKSGIGFMISWFDYVMPDVYNRVYAHDPATLWDFSKFTPEVVIVNLGQNDSWLVQKPEHEQFKAHFGTTPPTADFIIKHYQDFIRTVRSKYPSAKIVCALGSMDATSKTSPFPGYITEAVKGLKDKNIVTHFFKYKDTPGHPSEQEQKDMADDLISYLAKEMKW